MPRNASATVRATSDRVVCTHMPPVSQGSDAMSCRQATTRASRRGQQCGNNGTLCGGLGLTNNEHIHAIFRCCRCICDRRLVRISPRGAAPDGPRQWRAQTDARWQGPASPGSAHALSGRPTPEHECSQPLIAAPPSALLWCYGVYARECALMGYCSLPNPRRKWKLRRGARYRSNNTRIVA